MDNRGVIRFLGFCLILLIFFLFLFLKAGDVVEITGFVVEDGEFTINETVFSKIEISNNGEIVAIDGSFQKYNLIGCAIDYSGDSTGVNLSIGIYSESRNITDPNILYLDVFNEDIEEFVCDEIGTACLAYYNVTEFELGNWKCFAKWGDNLEESNELEMINGAPIFSGVIDDVTLNMDDTYNNTIDLDVYFEDLEGDEITYGSVGQLHLNVSVSDDGLVSFNNLDDYEGTETIKFRAHDGFSGTFSNNLFVIVGSGVADTFSACNSIWDCNWDSCVDGQQTCDYFDRNNCGNEQDRPDSLVRSCDPFLTTESGANDGPVQLTGVLQIERPVVRGFGKSLVILGIIVLILLIVGVCFWLVFKKTKGDTKEKFKEIKEDSSEKIIKESDKTFKLRYYIEQALEQKQTPAKIKSDLVNVGWEQKEVEDSLNYVVLKKFVYNKLNSGFSKEDIIASLKTKGWKKEIIDAIFESLEKIK